MSSPKGLYCPNCRGVRLTVSSSKKPAPGVKVRYRKCSTCGHRFTTREVVVNRPTACRTGT
ncbi:NrdR family transcriptional regulator [Gemmata sp.]|uniref:NrdR family transcriptional regulator n=1 Tax=Gemmata sp. TaxID=1914242 RepID=UPI003F720306